MFDVLRFQDMLDDLILAFSLPLVEKVLTEIMGPVAIFGDEISFETTGARGATKVAAEGPTSLRTGTG